MTECPASSETEPRKPHAVDHPIGFDEQHVSSVVGTTLDRLRVLAHEPVPAALGAWTLRCHHAPGFPLLGTDREAEPYVALQWNGERAARAGLGLLDLVVLTGLVTAWEQDRSVGDLVYAVTGALAARRDMVPATRSVGAAVTADVVTTAVCAGLLSGVPVEGLPPLTDLAGTLLQVLPQTAFTPDSKAAAAGHTAAAGWLAVQVHAAGLVAYPGAYADTVATAALPFAVPDPLTPVRALVAGLR